MGWIASDNQWADQAHGVMVTEGSHVDTEARWSGKSVFGYKQHTRSR